VINEQGRVLELGVMVSDLNALAFGFSLVQLFFQNQYSIPNTGKKI
jgi:hypothetical protein